MKELKVKNVMSMSDLFTAENRAAFTQKALEGFKVTTKQLVVIELDTMWDEEYDGFMPKSKARRAKRFQRSNTLKDKNKHGGPKGHGLAGRENLSYGTKNDPIFQRKLKRDFAREGGIPGMIEEGVYIFKRGQELRGAAEVIPYYKQRYEQTTYELATVVQAAESDRKALHEAQQYLEKMQEICYEWAEKEEQLKAENSVALSAIEIYQNELAIGF